MRAAVLTILLISAVSAVCGDSLEASPGVLWEYALAHSSMMGSMESLIVSSDMIREASGRIPDPSVRFGWAPLPLETRNGPVLFSITLMQRIPWPGYLSKARSLTSSGVQLAILNRDLAGLELRSSITEVWSEMYLIRSRMDFLEGESARLQILLSTASSKYEIGEVSLSDLLRLENRIALIKTDQYGLELNFNAINSEMNSLIGRSMDDGFRWSDSLPDVESFRPYHYPEVDIIDFPLARRSFIEVEAARSAEGLSKERMRPSFEIGATWSVINNPSVEMGAVEEGGDGLMIFAGLSLPLGYSGSRYTHSAAQSSAAAAELTHSQKLMDLSSMRVDLMATIEGLIDVFSSYETDIVPNLEVILSLTESEWMTGAMNLKDVIEVISERRIAHLEMMSIYSQIVVEAAKLKELTGDITERGEFL